MNSNRCQTQSGKSKIQSVFRILRALHNFSEGKKRRKKVPLHFYEVMSRVQPFNTLFHNSVQLQLMLQLRGRRSVKGGKSSVRECLEAFPFPLQSPLVFFLREFFSRALLSERLEQGSPSARCLLFTPLDNSIPPYGYPIDHLSVLIEPSSSGSISVNIYIGKSMCTIYQRPVTVCLAFCGKLKN